MVEDAGSVQGQATTVPLAFQATTYRGLTACPVPLVVDSALMATAATGVSPAMNKSEALVMWLRAKQKRKVRAQ